MQPVPEESHSITQFLNAMFQTVAIEDIAATTDHKSTTDGDELMETQKYALNFKRPTEDSNKSQLHKYSTFLCNICIDHVRGGVITICGHLYCWTCLWPKLYQHGRPRCPRCLRRLILHEDIISFLSEGPYASPNDGVVLAQPGNVPRPTGMHLQNLQYPSWFLVNMLPDSFGYERNLSMIVKAMYKEFPLLMCWTNYLQWFELFCVLFMAFLCLYALMIF
ncbi:uncharacterized protein LOC117790633 [Drosophila innubila]|uniref:uncharacterized protein LOC117790633 n=1 Tax=Drosophila innubila TaxID=198719 RepID=UPI00148CAABE|nr:uncharacterized protein LOC117790633 [Drosophila innubila]